MKRNKFSLSHKIPFTCNLGELVPVGLIEVLPGDTFQHEMSVLLRCTALLAPVMHDVHVRIHHFFVPTRLVWDDWEDFITGGPDGEDASVYPTITFATGPGQGTLANYLGVPPKITGFNTDGISCSAIPFRMYAKIWNEFYRDQDLQNELTIDMTDGADTTTNTTLQYVSWMKDYFTSARADPQRGPDVLLPLGDTAPVVSDGTQPVFEVVGGGTERGLKAAQTTNHLFLDTASPLGADADEMFGSNTGLEADLSTATAVSVNALREALALQRFAERSMRFGNRYTEYLLSSFGVRSSDARLQRPEYLGGGKQTIQFSEVVQMAPGATTVTGQLRGHGISALRSNRYRRFFEEHGFVMSLMSVIPSPIYFNGLFRHWNRTTRFDFFQREFQNIGQQEIQNKEVYAAAASPTGTFAYQDRYDEYRRHPGRLAGDFSDSLNMWHFARMFGTEPALNSTFVSAADSPTRPFATTTVDTLQCFAMHRLRSRRPVSRFGASSTF